jgi:hypothetical protein
MNKLFTLAAVAVLFGTGIVGCSNTAQGVSDDAAKNTAAVEKGAATAVDKTVQGTEKAAAATEAGVANAAAATKDAADKAVVTTEKVAANAANATKDAADKAVVGTEKVVASAGEVATHTGKVLTITPTVKSALLRDNTLYPADNANLNKINVDTDSDGQTIHLKGTVKTADMKKKAEQIATDAVKDKGTYKISNELTVGAH